MVERLVPLCLEAAMLVASILAEIASTAPQSPQLSASSRSARKIFIDEQAAGFFASSLSPDGGKGRLPAAAACDEESKDSLLAVCPDQKRPSHLLFDFYNLRNNNSKPLVR
jgi:hypothetical protein